jgi:hypothetical protein
MHEPDPAIHREGTRRRSLFSGKGDPTSTSIRPGHLSPADRTEAIMSAYQQMIQEQLEEGLRALQHTANQLMHEIAGEVWRTAGGDKDVVQGKLLEALSRDQSIRSLIAHTDERFQALAVRTARVEDTLNMLAEGIRAAREQLAQGVDALQDVQSSPAARGVEDVRAQLNHVTRQISLALETLAERDRAIVEVVQQRVREHGELVSTETAAITRAMEAYVQQGVAVMGGLADDVEKQMATIRARDEEIGARITQAAKEQLTLLDERIGGIVERLTAETTALGQALAHVLDVTDERNRSLGEYLELMHDRIGMESRDVLIAVESMAKETNQILETRVKETNQILEARVKGLAELVRSDSVTLREELVRTAAGQDEAIARALDERLARVTETLATSTDWMVEEVSRRIRDDAIPSIRMRLDEAIAAIDRRGDETTRMLNGRLDDAVTSIDRNMVRMADTLEGQLERLSRTIGDRASEAVGRAQMRTEEVLGQTIDVRVAALAKMVRSDNESLARQIVADQEASKQALRAMKELQASLPADVVETIQRRMDDLSESVAKSQEMLAQRIDRMAAKIGERYDNDIQIVIDRMGDAMHALASLGRSPQTLEPDRVELE